MTERTNTREGVSDRRLAALDVGSNSIRLIVVEVQSEGGYRLLDDEKEVTRLGSGLVRTGRLSTKAMEASVAAIARMKQIAEGYGVKQLRAVATSAVREARNGQQFRRMVQNRAEVDLEVISAEDEARLAFKSVAHAFDLRSMNAAIVDIGGGSAEVLLSICGAVENVHTLQLGAVRLTDICGSELTDREYRRMRERIKETVKQHVKRPKAPLQALIGTGGTFTTLAAIAIARHASDRTESGSPSIRGYELQRSEVRHILDTLRGMSLKARLKVPGLSPERAEIIVSGIAIVDSIMRRLRINTLRVHDRGIRDGLVLNMIERAFPRLASRGSAPDRVTAVRKFARLCNYERAHSEHVTQLALEIYDQLAKIAPGPDLWTPVNRNLLESAAILHDVGYYINYAKHHKHSHHLIVHSEMPGFTHRELAIIGNIARYHRRAEPKKSHPEFASLSAEDRTLVTALSAILRVADGLDRTHSQQIRSVTVRPRRGGMHFALHSESEPTVDIWGATRKCGLFHKVFGMQTDFRWERERRAGNGHVKPASQITVKS